MKTHRIILPAEWHALALRGVSRLLLPMRPQPVDPLGVAIKGTSIRDGGSKAALWTLDRIHICPYRAGDRLALLEPWWEYRSSEIHMIAWGNGGTRCLFGNGKFQDEPQKEIGGKLWVPSDYDIWKRFPASRMPLDACRCFYRVASVEPVRISEISEAHARECGFEPNVNGWADAAPQAVTLWTEWFTGRVPDWAWSVRVERV